MERRQVCGDYEVLTYSFTNISLYDRSSQQRVYYQNVRNNLLLLYWFDIRLRIKIDLNQVIIITKQLMPQVINATFMSFTQKPGFQLLSIWEDKRLANLMLHVFSSVCYDFHYKENIIALNANLNKAFCYKFIKIITFWTKEKLFLHKNLLLECWS